MLYEKSYLPQGHMEKQEIEMKWKLEMGTGNWKRNLLAVVVIQMLLVLP